MNTLLFCFANNRERPLPELRQEDDTIDRLLDPLSSQQHFQKIRDSYATTDSVASKILTYQDSLCLFHFSGHAGSSGLELEDGSARAAGIAQLLARCKQLRLVFLNGCSTIRQIQRLQEQGVKAAIIATSTPIEDTIAARLSIAFYRALANGETLEEALNRARLALQVSQTTQLHTIRGAVEIDLEEVSRNQWYFFCPDEKNAHWKLPAGEEKSIAKRRLRHQRYLQRALIVSSIVVVGGSYGYFRTHQSFDYVVYLRDQQGQSLSKTKLRLRLGNAPREEITDAYGRAVITGIAARFQETPVPVELIDSPNQSFQNGSTTDTLVLTGTEATLSVIPHRDLCCIRGTIFNSKGQPVANAAVWAEQFPAQQTDSLGRFVITLPPEHQQDASVRVTARKNRQQVSVYASPRQETSLSLPLSP
ncbi:CHAT domain-containing protein [Larkinella sp.]|uniref:CHAT domain-containing protein n=1 Tax=Larkinella sp. TaxID=2034517 RepID=UPI003BACA5C4